MKILLVDDHPLFEAGFRAMLSAARRDVTLVAAGSSAEGCAMLRDDGDIDLVVVDLQLPDRDGFETLVQMSQIRPSTPRVLISGRSDAAVQTRARGHGAAGFISKSSPPAQILAQIDAVLRGESGFDSLVAATGADASSLSLSSRQFEVLHLLAEGCANKEMRYRMGIAERTVRAHLTELFHVLGVQSRVQAILRARELGLIT